MMMIHNPATIAMGDHEEMKKALSMLDEVKESIINANEIKTGLPRQKLSRLMDAETWMDANKALELGFVDGILNRETDDDEEEMQVTAMLFSRAAVTNSLMDKVAAKCRIEKSARDALRSNFRRVSNVLQEGVDADGGYLVPEEYNSRLIDVLEEENIMRRLGHVITTSGEHKINIAATKPAAAWIEEGGELTFGDDD